MKRTALEDSVSLPSGGQACVLSTIMKILSPSLPNVGQVCLYSILYERFGFPKLEVPQLTQTLCVCSIHLSLPWATWSRRNKGNQGKHKAHAAGRAVSRQFLCL